MEEIVIKELYIIPTQKLFSVGGFVKEYKNEEKLEIVFSQDVNVENGYSLSYVGEVIVRTPDGTPLLYIIYNKNKYIVEQVNNNTIIVVRSSSGKLLSQ